MAERHHHQLKKRSSNLKRVQSTVELAAFPGLVTSPDSFSELPDVFFVSNVDRLECIRHTPESLKKLNVQNECYYKFIKILVSPFTHTHDDHHRATSSFSANINKLKTNHNQEDKRNCCSWYYDTTAVLAQDWDSLQREQSVSWFEIFVDLIFVALIVLLTSHAARFWKKSTTSRMKFEVCLELFVWWTAFFLIWLELTVLYSRFILSGLKFYMIRFVYVVLMLAMVLQVEDARRMTFHVRTFAALLGGVSFLLFLTYFLFLVEIPGIWFHTGSRAFGFAICCIGYSVAAFQEYFVSLILTCSFMFIQLSLATKTFRVNPLEIPVNCEHFSERLGLLVMLCIGESLLSIVLEHHHRDSLGFGMTVLTFVYINFTRAVYLRAHHPSSSGAWWEEEHHHVETEDHLSRGNDSRTPTPEPHGEDHHGTILQNHALYKKTFPGSGAFVTAHLPLTFMLILVALAFKLALGHVSKYRDRKPLKASDAYLMGCAVALTHFAMVFIRNCHSLDSSEDRSVRWMKTALRLLIICFCITLPAYLKKPIELIVGLMIGTTFISLLDALCISCLQFIAPNWLLAKTEDVKSDDVTVNVGEEILVEKCARAMDQIDTKNTDKNDVHSLNSISDRKVQDTARLLDDERYHFVDTDLSISTSDGFDDEGIEAETRELAKKESPRSTTLTLSVGRHESTGRVPKLVSPSGGNSLEVPRATWTRIGRKGNLRTSSNSENQNIVVARASSAPTST